MKPTDVTPELQELFIETGNALKGHQRRLFMARTVKSLGYGGLKYAREELRWDKNTINKGQHELRTGIRCLEATHYRGRKRTEERLPNLLEDIKAIVDGQSQIDGTFKTERLYTRLTAKAVRQQLIKQKGYTDESLPTAKTIGVKLNKMGYQLRAVVKSRPKKR